MSELITYVGKCGSGKTLTLKKIARKELLLEKSVLVIASEKFEIVLVGSGELTIVYNDDIRRAVRAYEIIHNGDLPEVMVVDINVLTDRDIAFLRELCGRGVLVHVGVNSRRSSLHDVTSFIRPELVSFSDVIYHIERAFTLDGDAIVVLVTIKNRTKALANLSINIALRIEPHFKAI